jgi:hypothetical protein
MIRMLAVALLCASAVSAIDLELTPEDVDRALAIGRRTDAAFHRAYVREIETTTDAITVQRVEVVTPFRRLVLHSEARRRAAEFLVSRADVEPILREHRNRVTIVATLRFHPQNVLTSPPPLDLTVRDPILERNVPPLDAAMKAITKPGTPRPILGATVETAFDAGLLANLDASVVVSLRGKELGRATIDFRAID